MIQAILGKHWPTGYVQWPTSWRRLLTTWAVAVGLKNPYSLALGLLLVATLRHYGWAQFPPELRGIASKALGGVEVLALLALVWALVPSAVVRVVTDWSGVPKGAPVVSSKS